MRKCLSPRMLGLRLGPTLTVDLAFQYRFDGIELLVRDLVDSNTDLQALSSRISDAGVTAVSWPLPVSWRGNVEEFRRDLARLPAYAEAAARLGLDRTGTWALPEFLDSDFPHAEAPNEAALDWHVDRLDAIAAILGEHGQRLGLEAIAVPPVRTGRGRPLFDRLASLDPLLDRLRDRGRMVGLTVDAFHLYASGDSVDEVLRRGIDSILAVHLADIPEEDPVDRETLRDDRRTWPRPEGPVPCRDLLQRLSAFGYTGPVFAEPRPGGRSVQNTDDPPGSPEEVVRLTAAALASVWPTDQS